MISATQNDFQRIAATRMLELIDVRTPWNRALWQLGSIQSIREVLECASATWNGAISSPAALEYCVSRCMTEVKSDVGIGSSAVRELLADKLGELTKKGAGKLTVPDRIKYCKEIEDLMARANRDYLRRWSDFVSAGSLNEQNVERAARLILTHLLDDGFARTHIHGFLTHLLRSGTEKVLEEIITKGHDMCREAEREYFFAIPVLVGGNSRNIDILSDLLVEVEEIRTEIEDLSPRGIAYAQFKRLISRDPSAVVGLSAKARDPHAAANKVYERLAKISERSNVGRGRSSHLVFSRYFLDRTNKKLRDREPGIQSVIVPSLERHGLYASDLNTQLDNALGLLSTQENLSPGASVAMLWAAAEGLLGNPGAQGVDVATGLASIVACSFPRAELEDLIGKEFREDIRDSSLTSELSDAEGSDKAKVLLEALRVHGSEIFLNDSDRAAASRVMQIDSDPKGVLTRIQQYFEDVFRRLYYQRNFIMHAAKFDSVSLPSTMRSAPKLVAAGIDRVVHAQYVRTPADPLALASRARNELSLLGTDGAREIHRLLK